MRPIESDNAASVPPKVNHHHFAIHLLDSLEITPLFVHIAQWLQQLFWLASGNGVP
jgi:hypothetical protein